MSSGVFFYIDSNRNVLPVLLLFCCVSAHLQLAVKEVCMENGPLRLPSNVINCRSIKTTLLLLFHDYCAWKDVICPTSVGVSGPQINVHDDLFVCSNNCKFMEIYDIPQLCQTPTAL